MSGIETILFGIANALLYPCLVVLLTLFASTIFWLGGFAREALARRSTAAEVRRIAEAIAPPTRPARLPKRWSALLDVLARPGVSALDLEKFLVDSEHDMSRRVERVSLAAKIGPMLGLAGTLIPLGPALRAMGAGSVSELAHDLIVAFAATVVGLAVAGPCFWMATARKRWYEQDLAHMDLVARRALDAREASR